MAIVNLGISRLSIACKFEFRLRQLSAAAAPCAHWFAAGTGGKEFLFLSVPYEKVGTRDPGLHPKPV
jgi:hypothetical protein